MRDDVSSIPSGGCAVLTGERTISHYNGNTRRDFVFNGGKWHLYRTQTTNMGSYDISSYNCITVSDLNTNAVYEPFIYLTGFVLFLAAVILFFKTIKGFMYGF